MKYLSKLLGMLLVGAMLYSTGCTDYDADIKDINNRIDNLEKTQIEPLKKDLADTKTALENAIATAKSEILAKHEADVKDLKAADKEAQEAIAAALEAIKKGDDALDERLTEAEKAIETATGDIADLKTVDAEIKANLETISKNLTAVTGDVESLKQFATQMTQWSVNVEMAIATLNTQIEGIKESIVDLEADVKRIDELNAAQQGAIENLQEFQELAEEKFTALAKADEDIKALIANTAETLRGELTEYKDEVEKEFVKAFDAIAKNTADITALQAELAVKYAELVAKDKALAEAIDKHQELITNANLRIETLEGQVEDIQLNLTALTTDYNSFKEKTIADIKAAVERIESLDGRATQLELDLTALKNTVDEFQAAYDEHVADYNDFVLATKAAFENLQGLVDDVINRIQSIVYVPDYNDGKITVDYITFGGDILGGTTKIVYQVYPVEGAKAIADAFADPYNGFELSLELEGLKTRANEGPAMKINSVTAAENGRLTVEAAALNFPDAFFVNASFPAVDPAADPTEFAVSLVVDMTNTEEAAENVSNANLSTCYTMLTAGRADAITMAIYQNGKEVTEHPNNTKIIPYTQISENPDFVALEDHYLMFTYKGEKYTKEQLAELGYFVEPIASYTDITSYTEFKNSDSYAYSKEANAKGYNDPTLEITKHDGNLVCKGEREYYEFFVAYAYPESDLAPVSACDHLVISPEERVITLPVLTINWEYLVDAEVDADRLNGGDMLYEHKVEFDLAAVSLNTELPDDLKLADVINGVTFTKDDVNYVITTTGEKAYLTVAGFEWGDKTEGKKYVVEVDPYVYEDRITANVNFEYTTFDRVRDLITINLGAKEYKYASNLILDKQIADNFAEALAAETVAKYAVNFPEVDSDYYMNDNFVANALYDNNGTVDGETVYTSDANGVSYQVNTFLNIEGPATVHTCYNYMDTVTYDGIWVKVDLNYETVVTLWYGQQVKFTKTLQFPQYEYIWFIGDGYFVSHTPNYPESTVHAHWSPSQSYESPVSIFDVDKFDLLSAFDLTDATGKLYQIPHEGENRGFLSVDGNDYQVEFYFDETQTCPGYVDLYNENFKRGILLYNNFISYYGAAKYVDVNAHLYLLNNNDTKFNIITNFDKDLGLVARNYTKYRVNQYNPIQEPTSQNKTEVIYDQRPQPYRFDVANLFSMKDARGWELINKNRDVEADPNAPFLVVGDGNNGFAVDYNPENVFGFYSLLADGTSTNPFNKLQVFFNLKYNQSAEQMIMNGILKVDDKNGVVTFDYSKEVELVKDIEIYVDMVARTAWTSYQMVPSGDFVDTYKCSATLTITKGTYDVKPENE